MAELEGPLMAIRRTVKFDEESYKRQRAKKARLPENSTYALRADPTVRRDMMLLACMLWIPLDHMASAGKGTDEGYMHVSPDTAEHVHRAFAVMVKRVPRVERMALARKVLDDADTCLRASEAADARGAALAAAYLIVKLTDEGLIRDAGSNVVLAALAIMQEAERDGQTGPWRYRHDWTAEAGTRVWQRAQLAGYLLQVVPAAPQPAETN